MPFITVSRMFGAGGSEVAAATAAALGWTLLDNAIVESVATRLGLTIAEVQAREERVPGLAQRLADALALGSPEALPLLADRATLPPSEERVLEVTRRVIDEAVAQGPVVLVGRGAQSLLAEREDAFHVYCYAPASALIARVASRENISPEEAERRVNDVNHQREQYVKRHWGRDWRAMGNYHLCVNTAWMGIDGAVEAVVTAAQRFFAPPRSTT